MKDRRNFLKVFGVTGAAVAGVGMTPPTEEVLTHEEAGPPLKQSGWSSSRNYYDVVSNLLYDRLTFHEGESVPNVCDFFKLGVIGPGGYARGLEDTNVYQACKLDAPEAFLVKSMGVCIVPGCDGDMEKQLINNYCVELWIGQKCYARSPLAMAFAYMPAPWQPKDVQLKARTVSDGFYKLELPVVIPYDAIFHMSIRSSLRMYVGAHDLSMYGVLNGLDARGVQ